MPQDRHVSRHILSNMAFLGRLEAQPTATALLHGLQNKMHRLQYRYTNVHV